MRAPALIAALILFGADVDPAFIDALNTAKQNAKTPEGAKYDQVFGKSFAEKHQRAMMTCVEGLTGADLAPFDIVARVGANGKLEVTRFEPRTKVARCLERKMTGDPYPPPPQPGWWVHVQMSIRE